MINKRIIVFFVFILFWFFLSIFNVFYNSAKSISEFHTWAYLSNIQKKQKIFGDQYNYFLFIDDHTNKNAKILFLSSDVMAFYYGRYQNYPRLLSWVKDTVEVKQALRMQKYSYIATYDTELRREDYILVASFSGQQSSHFGYLYKRK
jgi:hypothetical protein